MKNLHLPFRLLFKIIITCLIPEEGSSYQISWDHKYFLWFLINKQPLNLSAYISHHLYESIKDSLKHKKSVPYARLFSKIFYQCRLIDMLKKLNVSQDLKICYGNILSSGVLRNMQIRRKRLW